MSTHTIDPAARQGARHVMNTALLRIAGVAALSIVFALVDCVGSVIDPLLVTPPASSDAPTVAHAPAAATADSLDHRVGGEAPTRRN